ncbi:hypothetical protein N7448_000696 [Penicillium atrosanguineum]|uniref:Uncharacterized protein n=1 Tax=Penicillium atrosanguineum TaxID=1132637 RepID=A0A9W9Q3Z2_9EURO|nr:uncharacterized protein N7443_004093 [Penicillium atrosanguineum]KAJ5134280.1 hypothetical protein N7526_005645 [Penicillium atrosanguineum]KAJ5149118.1 hypothetical protein N7448_000696 [Penicillium atrosanguineum]KAJ5304433.1 hypothetical protein N7443_004093 [Penicillium atrosanguineum]KAJ5323904.1 hypothetical protein N7476_002504 [Penicillium atrosanguineum]
MQSTIHQGPFPDRSREQATPPFETVSHENHEPQDVKEETVSEQNWTPRVDRRQSWSHEDQKHQMQERLMQVEQGRESGFSEEGR